MKQHEIKILESICKQMGVTVEQTRQTTRRRQITEARQMFVYWLRNNTTYSLHTIAKMVRDVPLDHTTVMHNSKHMAGLIQTDDNIRDIYNSLSQVDPHSFSSLSHRPTFTLSFPRLTALSFRH